MTRTFVVFCAALVLAACGGGGGGGGSSSSPPPPAPAPALSNFATIAVDAGPAALQAGANGYIADDTAFVSVTICAPGTNNCQTIDHVEVDTGSVGLRLLQPALTPSVLSALPSQTDATGGQVGECYQYVDGYVFGSVRQADFTVGGESVGNMPIQVVGDTGAFSTVPTSCSSGGGSNLNTVQAFGANGILGIGQQTTDCGTSCTTTSAAGPAIYYDCPASGCSAVTVRSAQTTAPFQQLPNPVAAFSVDNNGTIMSLPSVAASGATSVSGTLYFGIGTQTNNALGSASLIPASATTGFTTATYKGAALPNSYIDSGTNFYAFTDSSIPGCTGANYKGYYCPTAPQVVSVSLTGSAGAGVDASFTLLNAQSLLSGSNSALPGVGGDPDQFDNLMGYPKSFAFGLPFFFGRNIYTTIAGRTVSGSTTPFYAY